MHWPGGSPGARNGSVYHITTSCEDLTEGVAFAPSNTGPGRRIVSARHGHLVCAGGTVALIAFDGTWNEAKETEDPRYKNTNVFRFYKAYHDNSGTDDFYVPGVGTRYDLVGRYRGGRVRSRGDPAHPRSVRSSLPLVAGP
ncbi:MAG: DUF2235 domain-containing protein [Acidimicrobiia bacterium]|nr:DUF2235 domain-containing protein [Acidimicrobiia bacterium]